MLIPELVYVPVVVVPIPVEWYQLVPILLPVTLPVTLVSRYMMASFLLDDFPNSRVETK